MKKIRKLFLITIPFFFAVLWLFTDVRRVIGALVMLFTQNSTQSLQGYIMRSGFPFGITVFLSFFQMAFLPWYPPRIYIAGAVSLGKSMGFLAAVLGNLLAWSFWFILVKLAFLHGNTKLQKPPQIISGLITLSIALIFPSALPLIAAAAVLLNGSIVACSAGALAAVSIRAFLYIHYCSLYSSYLPNAINNTVKITGIIIILLVMIYTQRKKFFRI